MLLIRVFDRGKNQDSQFWAQHREPCSAPSYVSYSVLLEWAWDSYDPSSNVSTPTETCPVQNLSQTKDATSAGISRSTLSLLERGETVRMDSFIQVLRVLDLLHVMDVFKINVEISPLEYAKIKKKQRKKASPNSDFDIAKEPNDLGW